MPPRSILVADDIENQTDAGKRRSLAIWSVATFLARRLNTTIDLLYVEDIKAYPYRGFDPARFQGWHSRHEIKIKELARRNSISVRAVLKGGSVPDEILKTLRVKTAPELIVMGTQGRKGLNRVFIGSVAEEVVRHSRRPVIVIGPVAQKKSQDTGALKKLDILVATDLSKNSRPAERYALSLARRIGARVVLFHCLGDSYRIIIHESSMVSGWVPFNLEDILEDIRNNAERSMKQKTDFFRRHDVPCEYKIEDTPITSSCAVYQEGDKGYSFIVMGTHGRNVLLEAYFGSTARETILNASIPVIIVHSGK
ncbi:MAG TPA: universal stress protein [Nitrospirota bacterium]|nr:universal stress protein [Nitrospirota bacterium]